MTSETGGTRIRRVQHESPDPAVIRRAAAILRRGGLVAFPTETVYGLGANALDATAVRRIFEAKGRPAGNPLIVHVADAEAARRLVASWPPAADALARAFWPGPLTMVLPKRPEVPDEVTAGLPTVAVRAPAHPVALALLRAAGLPVAAPSANPFTAVSPTTAQHVQQGLGDRVDMILDAGPTTVGIESTVVDLSPARPVVLRPGMISVEELRAVIGEVDLHRGDAAEGVEAPRPSPGMMTRHYAPGARVRIFRPEEREAVAREAREAAAAGSRVGALLRSTRNAADPGAAVDHPIRMPDEPAAYARRLYAALHTLESAGCDLILIESVPETPDWAGIRDRIRRAAG